MYKLMKVTQEDIPQYLSIGTILQPCVLYGIHDKPFAWICKEEMCDLDYIRQNNIPYIKIDAFGSTIVCSEGDLNLGFFGTKEFCDEMFNRLSNKFSELLTDSKFINNDFMYNGCKYGAVTHIDFGHCYYVGMHISNNINKDLINKICKKQCFKTPEKLPRPITEADVLNIFKDGEIVYYEDYCQQ